MLFLVPFFFFISGTFYNEKELKVVFKDKISSIIKPVFFTVLLYNMIFWDGKWYNLYSDAYGIFQFPLYALWFMPTLFVTILLGSIVAKSEQNNFIWMSLLLVLIALTSYKDILQVLFDDSKFLINSRLPFTAESLIFTIPLFLLGYYLKDYVLNFKIKITCLLLYIVVIIFSIFKLNVIINIGIFVFHPYMICLITSLFAIYILLCVSQMCKKYPRLSWLLGICGKNSLYIALFHGPLLFHIDKALNKLDINLMPMFIKDLTVFSLSVFVSLLFKSLLGKNTLTKWMFAIREK